MDSDRGKRVIGAQVSGETAAALSRLAAESERTLSAEIRIALRAHLARKDENHTHELKEVA